jgi:hypothetical protein
LGPFLRSQVDGNERTKTSLNISHEEHEPVEPAQRPPGRRRRRRRFAGFPTPFNNGQVAFAGWRLNARPVVRSWNGPPIGFDRQG